LGSYEQMGPAKLEDSATFWRQAAKISIQGVRIRERERLSAVSLVKRFAAPVFLAEELALSDRKLLRWDDTATVGAAEWLDRAQKSGFPGLDPQAIRERPDGNWSGQWLHAASQKEGEDDQCPDDIWAMIRKARQSPELGKPPAYYAILMMDGDHLGSWLRGERSPAVEDVMHSKMVKYYRGLRNDRVEVALKARRPVGPALHAALSEALANFALHFVPKIVEDHFGTLVYAGGDDVLALLPTSTALACALELNEALRSDWRKDKHGRERLLMGSRATLSGGLVIVHHKEDLRFALGEARAAEKRAKEAGRNALELSVCRRSGEHASALCPWDFVPTVTQWVQNFRRKNVSDRWAYRLRAEQPTLEGLGADITQAEIRRQIKRAEDSTRFAFGWEDKDRAGDELVKAFDLYRSAKSPPDGDSPDGTSRFDNHGQAFEQFITLCQSASFLARGRDQ
jgi:CRISPR-associated protein Cmr2